ncbi:MAG: hypothetical protein IKP33_08500, partial [Prevotella sp.]|nr:hypothetical protein [Prevotella sp.]
YAGVPEKSFFSLHFPHLFVPLNKVGCTSAIKINANLFCISLGLNKFFSLKKENLFSFSSLNQNFALPL